MRALQTDRAFGRLGGGNYSDRLKVVKMEIDPNPNTVKEYKVEGVPALRLFKNAEVVLSHEGAISKEKLIGLLDAHV